MTQRRAGSEYVNMKEKSGMKEKQTRERLKMKYNYEEDEEDIIIIYMKMEEIMNEEMKKIYEEKTYEENMNE